MEKRLLIAVDASDASHRAVRYAGHLAGMVGDLGFMLLHVLPGGSPSPSAAETAATVAQAQKATRRFESRRTGLSEPLLERFQNKLHDMGTTVERMAAVSRGRKEGVPGAILDFGHENPSMAVIVGRRRLSNVKRPFLGSVSAGLVKQSTCLPIWIVGSSPPNQRFLVPVDGSESALRAVDHISQVFKGQSDVGFQFFHAIPRMAESCAIDCGPGFNPLERAGQRGVRHCIDNFWSKAVHILKAAGLGEDQIDITVADSLMSPGRSILAEINRGDYRTVVIGRRGIKRSFFTGSVSRYLIGKTEHITLWLVP